MNVKTLKNIINRGEGLETEFKTCSFQLPTNVFETVSAFLNRIGGHIILGVNNNGIIEGVLEDSIDQIKTNFANGCNDTNQLNPTYYLSPEEFVVDKKKVIYIHIPEGSQVHKTRNKIFDRNEDGDFEITNNPNLVSEMYLRKQTTFSENKIYPFLTLEDFELELLAKIRTMANNQRAGHPWKSLDDDELLKSAGLWKKDYQSGTEGFTLASVVLLGKEATIQSILPHYKTDAILRVQNLDRYDDRLDLRCNLFRAYNQLLEFIQKHLPDKFHLEGTNRISLRDSIFREIIANLLVHREFLNHFPAKLIIESDKVITENSNKPHGNGKIDLSNFTPFPKNPTIAKFFKEIGLVEELGSGIRKSYKYSKFYGNKNPKFIEGDIFKSEISIPIIKRLTATINTKISISVSLSDEVKNKIVAGLNAGLNAEISEGIKKLLVEIIILLKTEGKLKLDYIAQKTNKKPRTLERHLKTLRDLGIIELEGSKKIGGYVITNNFEEKIKNEVKDI